MCGFWQQVFHNFCLCAFIYFPIVQDVLCVWFSAVWIWYAWVCVCFFVSLFVFCWASSELPWSVVWWGIWSLLFQLFLLISSIFSFFSFWRSYTYVTGFEVELQFWQEQDFFFFSHLQHPVLPGGLPSKY